VIGVVGTLLAHRSWAPAAIWMVPAILPLPAPATLLPRLAETEAAQHGLQGQALQTAFAIGVCIASGSFLITTCQRYTKRVLRPVADAMSEGLAAYLVRPVKRQTRRWRRWGHIMPVRRCADSGQADPGLLTDRAARCAFSLAFSITQRDDV
jgi:hypothetical protein